VALNLHADDQDQHPDKFKSQERPMGMPQIDSKSKKLVDEKRTGDVS
jgi:hypothetical protein